jgi:hypothetical protein
LFSFMPLLLIFWLFLGWLSLGVLSPSSHLVVAAGPVAQVSQGELWVTGVLGGNISDSSSFLVHFVPLGFLTVTSSALY